MTTTRVFAGALLVLVGFGPAYGQTAASRPADAMVAAAAKAGVAERDITKAILEARFVPPFEQLEAVALSLGKDSTVMTEEWNRRFGALKDVGSVRTIQFGAWVTRTAKDLQYMFFTDTSDGLFLHQDAGLQPEAQPTYDQAIAFFGTNRGAVIQTDKAMQNQNPSLWDYFNNAGTTLYRDRRRDYELLRRSKPGDTVVPVEELTCESFGRVFRNEPYSRIWFGLQRGCQRQLRPNGTQLIIAGVLDALGAKCPAVKSGVMEGATVTAFVGAVTAGAVSLNGRNWLEQWQNGLQSAAVFKGGATLPRVLECGPEATAIYKNGVDWVEYTSSGPSAKRYVDGCVTYYKGDVSPAQCKCLGTVGRGAKPDIFEEEFSPDLFRRIVRSSPYTAAAILGVCQIQRY